LTIISGPMPAGSPMVIPITGRSDTTAPHLKVIHVLFPVYNTLVNVLSPAQAKGIRIF
jgi:hypothetical protein